MMSLLSFMLFWAVAAQEGANINATRLPQTAATVREFVPRGWEVETQVVGDLNRDSLPDLAVTLVESMPANADKDNPPERQRALLVLLKTADGNFTRAALGNKVLLCTRCGGAFYGVSETPTTVEIVNGIIIVTQEYGSREVTEETYRFRFEPESKRFAFIGVDLKSYDRATGESMKESTNLLTGVKLTTKSKMAEDADKETVVANSRQRINSKKRFLEDVAARYNEQEEK